MHISLIVVPDARAGSRKDGLDGEQIPHLSRLEDSPLGIDEGDALAFENKTRLQFVGGQMAMHLAQHSNMLESRHPNQCVPVNVAHGDIPHPLKQCSLCQVMASGSGRCEASCGTLIR